MEIVLSVSQCVEAINIALDSLGDLTVEGEVSGFNVIHNKWVTFDIKDDTSVLKCFMTVWSLRVAVEDGMLVRVTGKPNLRAKGFLSFVVQSVKPSGEGSLKRAFELLRQKLAQEGLFAPERKRILPRFPQHIALITSKEAAAYADFLKVLRVRQGGLTISFIHTQVQGDDAPRQIIAALETANTELENLDAIILVRGGGSLEDLMAFNDEHVVRAVAGSRTPTIVGIGHERDVSLAELAADIRASTPSNAAELLVRTREEILLDISRMRLALTSSLAQRIANSQANIKTFIHAMSNRLHQATSNTSQLLERIRSVSMRIKGNISASQQKIDGMKRVLVALSPERVLARGFSITRNSSGAVLKHAKDATIGEELTTTLLDGAVSSVVQKTGA
ncbi:MAG: exodeoxyribonuclease VII large subunit [Candidatus Andersenbacteria bacterium RIFCSPHIGHO2_12_FULL_45_11b]|uniref:Exodeoxyribonuclease 7 large subunit n=1 Tax=Candidatus Andersenbacteria bacterium RIFCSPHIGHO2_12_FULL_45_11b TaxID=1797282 RepID=A0A1G1XAU5_9BACT|nr:MAG: exodeoxyribonuclease VII large subunit [Candidatus Andersenbacteria bacterium RIFCSPHIGHO2_12_FULL_45_11b]